jgi:hypothetical protein
MMTTAALIIFAALTRAREAGAPAGRAASAAAAPSRPTCSSRLGGGAAAGDVADSFFVISVRGDDGARAIGAIDDVGGRRRGASYGVIDNRSENLQH